MNLFLFSQLLADEAEEVVDESSSTSTGTIVTYVFLGVIVVALIAIMVVSSRRNKKRQKEAQDIISAVKPGNKVKTIGGVCGIVVEVDDEENTFVLETGSENSGKCYMKFDKQAIYQTDAALENAPAAASEEEAPEPVDVGNDFEPSEIFEGLEGENRDFGGENGETETFAAATPRKNKRGPKKGSNGGASEKADAAQETGAADNPADGAAE